MTTFTFETLQAWREFKADWRARQNLQMTKVRTLKRENWFKQRKGNSIQNVLARESKIGEGLMIELHKAYEAKDKLMEKLAIGEANKPTWNYAPQLIS